MKRKENPDELFSPSREAYRKLLAETFNMNRTRILAFKNKPRPRAPTPEEAEFMSAAHQVKPRRHIPKTPEKTLEAPDILDDYYLNLLDWGSRNVLSIALGDTLYLWDASDGISELVTIDEESGPVTSVKWAPDGRQIVVGLNNSEVQLWDTTANTLLITMKGGHQPRVGALDWNNHILTTGGMDGRIINNDVRVRAHIVETYKGHQQEVCGLKWLKEHTTVVRALAWCPFQGDLLASGGGSGDGCIKFWNTHTGACLNSVNTWSQVCALLWDKNEWELLSSHGSTHNQLILWKYPSMVKIAELTGHTSRVLFMSQSPNGCTVASAAGDETLQFWNVFEVAKPAPKTSSEPFAHVNHTHFR
ncbi:hypothetical protein ACS0TY_034365 [Phlomoides rotata]